MTRSREAIAIPELGVGVVWWPELDPICRPGEGLVQVVEAEPESFWIPHTGSSGFTSQLPLALAHLPQPKILHGVGAPFGGGVAQTAAHSAAIAGDVATFKPAWISDHLSFNQFVPDPVWEPERILNTGFFLPPAQCPAGVTLAANHIRQRWADTGVPVAFEVPVSYLPPRPGEMTDGAFVAAVAEAADCGILLDLHNVLCNERNGRQSVRDFCESIPLDRVWEIHLAGGQPDRGFWLDAHCGLAEPALMEILAEIVPRLPVLGAIVFEIIPDYIAHTGLQAIGELLGKIDEVWQTRGVSAASPRCPNFGSADATGPSVCPALWEQALGAALTGLEGQDLPPELATWLRSVAKPLELYRSIARENRASTLVFTAPRTIRLLLTRLGEAETRRLLAGFWDRVAPGYTAVEEARLFLNFFAGAHLTVTDLEASITADRGALDRQTAQA